MASETIHQTFSIKKLAKEHVTMIIRLKGMRVFKLRMKIGIVLLKLAAKIIGVGIEMEETKNGF